MAEVSNSHPLSPPERDSIPALSFLRHFQLETAERNQAMLASVASAFSKLPYENLTKIIKADALGSPADSLRGPQEVIADHLRFGTGGTCFSLTAALLHIVRWLGYSAEPLLADRRYGPNTHCALAVWLDGRPHLVDPGYLICEPIPLHSDQEQRIAATFNDLVLRPQADGKLELHTITQGRQQHRLTFKTEPADEGAFLRAWRASFDWDMMHYPLLTRVVGAEQVYLQGTHLQVRGRERVDRTPIIPDDLVREVSSRFGIAAEVVRQALTVLDRQGVRLGETASR